MGVLDYCRLVFCTAWRHSASWAQVIIFFIFVIAGAAILLMPRFGMTFDASGLAAMLSNPTFYAILFGSVVLVRLVCAPYWIWKEERAARINVESQIEELSARHAPLEGHTSAALALRINVFRFIVGSPSDRGTYKLYLNLKALEAIDLTRIKVRFNRPGGNGCYQLADYAACPHQMLLGEELELVLIHYRPNIGTFWGDLDRVTERRNLDHLNQEERERHLELSLDAVGPYYYCNLVARHTRGEVPLNFTVLVPSRSERPCVLTGGLDHKDYDHNRLIPDIGTFLS